MLFREVLVRIARARGLAPWQEEKRYVQALVLHALRGEPLVLKGGTYLWLFHGLDRFSEDLDFAAAEGVGPGLPSACVDGLGLFGVESTAKPVKDDGFTLSFRVDARGPLHQGESDLCRVYVEISKREKAVKRPSLVRLDEAQYGLPIDFLRGMPLVEVLAEKTRALMRRKAVRDLYDIWFLLRRKAVEPDWRLIRRKLAFYKLEFRPSEFERCVDLAGEGWKKELESVVFGALLPFDDVRADVSRLMKRPS